MAAKTDFDREVNIEALLRLVEVFDNCPDIERDLRTCGGASVALIAMKATVLYDLEQFQHDLAENGLVVNF